MCAHRCSLHDKIPERPQGLYWWSRGAYTARGCRENLFYPALGGHGPVPHGLLSRFAWHQDAGGSHPPAQCPPHHSGPPSPRPSYNPESLLPPTYVPYTPPSGTSPPERALPPPFLRCRLAR